MTEDTVYILLWMLIVATFGFMIGWAGGEELSRRRCAEEKVKELQEQLECTAAPGQDQHWLFQKASKNPPPKPRRINSRFSPSSLFQKVWI